MQPLLPTSFLQALEGLLALAAIGFGVSSLWTSIRSQATRLSAIFFVAALALFSNHWTTYFASLFIIATAITKLEFLQNLAAIIRGGKSYFDYKTAMATSSEIQPSPEEKPPSRGPMEYKILNTLWTHQVNYFPDYSGVWTFRINALALEYGEFREAINKLIGENLVSESDQGQYYLTRAGFQYCKEHYEEFPPEHWWPESPIDKQKLERALEL